MNTNSVPLVYAHTHLQRNSTQKIQVPLVIVHLRVGAGAPGTPGAPGGPLHPCRGLHLKKERLASWATTSRIQSCSSEGGGYICGEARYTWYTLCVAGFPPIICCIFFLNVLSPFSKKNHFLFVLIPLSINTLVFAPPTPPNPHKKNFTLTTKIITEINTRSHGGGGKAGGTVFFLF